MAIRPELIETYEHAVNFLEARIGQGVKPGLERTRGVLETMTDPQGSYPIIHVAGTNGKTTTVRLLDSILTAGGMRTGTYVSPHLHAIEGRYTFGTEPLDKAGFARAVGDIAPFVQFYEGREDTSLTYFETTVAVAFQAFAAAGVDVAIVEVGLGGRLDATNVVDADVSVITGIAIDHVAYLGESIASIAAEKAAILKEGGLLITGPLPPAAEGAIAAQVDATFSGWLRAGSDFKAIDVTRAVGGWQCTVDGVHATYEELHLPLHGRHQVDHLATAIAATEMFFDRPLDEAELSAAVGRVTSPGRLEVVSRQPLVLVDGAHNVQSLEGLATTVLEEFPATGRVLVVGFRGDRDVAAVLEPLQGLFAEVVVTAADDPEALSTDVVAAGARTALGEDVVISESTPVAQALTDAFHQVGEDDMLVVTGSLYVVGDALDVLRPQ